MTQDTADGTLQRKMEAARRIIADLGPVVVAFSGGVDSALLLRLAVASGAGPCLAVTARSPSLAQAELDDAVRVAAEMGARHVVVQTHELERTGYTANATDRCYHCKTELFSVLRRIAEEAGGATMLYGANVDDLLATHRPGQRAAAELGARAPLAEAGFTKFEVREASRQLGLSTWNKPQLACLASRFPYGTIINAERLQQIERAEAVVRDQGFFDVRVRYHGDVARLELGMEELSRLLEPTLRRAVVEGVRAAGFAFVTVDLEGFRSGRLNEVVPALSPVAEVHDES
ncbi:MAG: ATP-dependent sacrificial sulfur transferase LarE [Pseudomonadota bacterium]